MSPFIIKTGKKVWGRLLAHDEEHARKQARDFWPALSEKKITVEPVKKRTP